MFFFFSKSVWWYLLTAIFGSASALSSIDAMDDKAEAEPKIAVNKYDL